MNKQSISLSFVTDIDRPTAQNACLPSFSFCARFNGRLNALLRVALRVQHVHITTLGNVPLSPFREWKTSHSQLVIIGDELTDTRK